MTSLNFFKGFSVIRTASVAETAEHIVWMCEKIEKNMLKGVLPYYLQHTIQTRHSQMNENEQNTFTPTIEAPANYCTVVKKVKKENVTPENIGEIVLCQIPGISSITAISIMKKFGSFPQLMKALQDNPSCMDDVNYESNGKVRKINKPCIDNIKKYFL